MRERTARGTRRRRKRRGGSAGFFLLLILIVLMGAGALFICGRLGRKIVSLPKLSETQREGSWGETQAEGSWFGENSDAVSDPDEEEWCLTLVNRWNPMKTDGSEIETVELSNGERVDRRIYPQLQQMFEDARAAGVYPIVASGYRTWGEQEELYYDKIEEYRAQGMSEEEAKQEAERWVAVPGTSEHQLGLSVDINADGINSAGGEVYDWLAQNAHRYGFINRYPSDKTGLTGIANEPWHYRYVGTRAAAEIYEQGVCLEEYLGQQS